MHRYLKLSIILFIFFSGFVFANPDKCSSVISLSKTSHKTISNQNAFMQEAANFCEDYSNYKASGNSGSFGASYAGFGLSAGASKSEVDSVARKLCKSKSSSQARNDAFTHYMEIIAPQAFAAYEACLTMSSGGVILDFGSVAEKEDYLSLPISFKPRVSGEKALMSYASSDGVTCNWGSSENKDTLTLSFNGEDKAGSILVCKRAKSDDSDFITLSNRTDGSHVTFYWQHYIDGSAESKITQLSATIDELTQFVQRMTGAVVPFEAEVCPDGWRDYPKAFGRFIRGWDKSKKLDPDSHREVGSVQDDSFKAHSHQISLKRRWGDKGEATEAGWGGDDGYHSEVVGISDETGEAETRPKNVALLYCVKN